MTAAPSTEHHTGALELDAERHGQIPAPLSTTSSITLWGSLIWLAPLWACVLIGGAIALSAVARWGSLDASLWADMAAGWQRWPVGAVGFTMIAVFAPMFVTNGVTRARLGQSAALTMAVVSLLGSVVITAGFAIEAAVFDAEGWPHLLYDDLGRTAGDVGYATIFATFAVVNAAWFASGWLAATALSRLGWILFVPFLVVALAPAFVTDLLVMGVVGSRPFGVPDEFRPSSLWIGIPLALGVIGVTTSVAAWWTRTVTVE